VNDDFFAPLALRGEHVCDVMIRAQAEGPGRVDSPWGAMMIHYIADGSFSGPRLAGRVLPGGGDWPALSNDGRSSMRIDARAVWETHDGARIFVRYEGYVVFPPPAERRDADVASLDPAKYYLRTTPIFRTGDERYRWLNETVCVGVGRFAPGGLGYRIYAIG